MGLPADVLGDIIGDSTHPSPSDSLHLILAHDMARNRLHALDASTASTALVDHITLSGASTGDYEGNIPGGENDSSVVEGQIRVARPLERGSATAGGAKARRMLLAAEDLLRCHKMQLCTTVHSKYCLIPVLSFLSSTPLSSFLLHILPPFSIFFSPFFSFSFLSFLFFSFPLLSSPHIFQLYFSLLPH